MMQDSKKDALRRHREDIANNIHDITSVVNKLSDYKIITNNMEEEILCKPTRIAKCRELLNILPRRSDNAFDVFCHVLIDSGETTAASFLEGISGISIEHQLPSVFPDPNDDSKIVKVQKCRQMNGDPMYEKYKKSASDTNRLGDTYQMRSNPRGCCVVINNENFDKHIPLIGKERLSDRPGSQHDVDSLGKLFIELHFLFEVHNNKTAQEINDLVKNYKEMDHSNYNCFVLVILSHGSHGNVCGVDGKDVAINDIVSKFDSGSCESLRGKPKLFFIQACRGDRKDQGTQKEMTVEDQKEITEIIDKVNQLHLADEQTDATYSSTHIPRKADMLIAMATSPGFVSWRDQNKGTWFIQAVVYAFKYWGHSHQLVELMTKVNHLVQKAETRIKRNKQCPEWQSSLGKSLFFFPGLVQPETQPNVPQPRNQQSQENQRLAGNQLHPEDQSNRTETVPNRSSC